MCLTASAPPSVEVEIKELVGLHTPVVVKSQLIFTNQ